MLIVALLAATAFQAEKHPVPSTKDQRAAEAEVRELYKEEYGAKNSAARRGFAQKLLDAAAGTKDPVFRYVLLSEASTAAGEGFDLWLGLRAIRRLEAGCCEMGAPLRVGGSAARSSRPDPRRGAHAPARSRLPRSRR